MAQLEAVLSALTQGKSVRRDEWEPLVRMFVSRDMLMCQCGNMEPWQHALTWGELAASDWQLMHDPSADQQASEKSAVPAPVLRGSRQALPDSLVEAAVRRNPLLFWLFPKRGNS
jgi:hypothetical protein